MGKTRREGEGRKELLPRGSWYKTSRELVERALNKRDRDAGGMRGVGGGGGGEKRRRWRRCTSTHNGLLTEGLCC